MQGSVIRSKKYTNCVVQALLRRLDRPPGAKLHVDTLVCWFTFDASVGVHIIVTYIEMRCSMCQPSIVPIFRNNKFHYSVRENKRPTKTVGARLRVIRAC